MRIAIKWGAILALALSGWTVVVHLLGIYTTRVRYAATVDQVVIIVPILVLLLALLEFRRGQGGAFPFGRALLVGLGVAAVSAPFSIAFMWYYHHYVNPEWVSYLTAYEQQKLAATGATVDEIAAAVTRLQQGGTDRAQIAGGLIGTMLMGFVLTLVIAGALKLQSRSAKVT